MTPAMHSGTIPPSVKTPGRKIVRFGCKPYWILTLNLTLVAPLGLGAFKFIIQGSTARAADGRTNVTRF